MREFRERSYFRKIFFSRPVFLLLLCFAIFISLSVFGAYKKSKVAVLKNREVEDDMKELLDKKETLESNISRLKGSLGIEKELREKFQVKKPDEEFVVIVEEKAPEVETEKQQEKKQNFLEKTWGFVKSLW